MEMPHAERQSSAAIELRQLSVTFDGLRALNQLDLTMTAGEITAVLGPSGCGKSTLLRCIAGLLPPHSGSVTFSLPQSPARERLAPGELGYVFQDAALLPWRSAQQNVRIPLELCGITPKPDHLSVAQKQLQRVGLEAEAWDRLPGELSGGMRMRVSIARALATDPSVLLLDEPFSALDELLRRRLGDLVLDLWQQRPRTVVLVTHNIDEALLLSDRIVVMREGRIAHVFDNPLDRFGTDDLRVTAAFAEQYARVSAALAGEADA